jgi:hypothetical protein
MSAVDTFSVCCPGCRAPIEATSEDVGLAMACEFCDTRFHVGADGSTVPARAPYVPVQAHCPHCGKSLSLGSEVL